MPMSRRFSWWRAGGLLALLLGLLTLSGCGSGSDDLDVASARIGPAGGTLTSPDGRLRLEVPAGALPADTDLDIRVISLSDADPALQRYPASRVYRFSPDGLRFAKPVGVVLLGEAPPQLAEQGGMRSMQAAGPPALLLASRGALEPLASELIVDEVGATSLVRSSIDHFSDLAVITHPDSTSEGDALRGALAEYPATIEVGDEGSTHPVTGKPNFDGPRIRIVIGVASGARFADTTGSIRIEVPADSPLRLFSSADPFELERPLNTNNYFGMTTVLVSEFVVCTRVGEGVVAVRVVTAAVVDARGRQLGLAPAAAFRLHIRCVAPAGNRPPKAEPDSYSTAMDTALVVPAPGFLANDSDPNGDTFSATAGTQPAHGTLSANVAGAFTYTPRAGFTGTDSFTYTVTDRNGASATGTVTIQVVRDNTPPDGAADRYATPRDTALVVDAPGILANDVDAEDRSVAFAVLDTGPANGRLEPTLDGPGGPWTGGFRYTPSPGFVGTDSFTYRPIDLDGQPGDIVEVRIDVTTPASTAQPRRIALASPGTRFAPEGLVLVPQTGLRPFPVPGAGATHLPIVVAGSAPAVTRGSGGTVTGSALVAIDALGGTPLFRYAVAGIFFDALPLQGEPEAGGVVDRLIGLGGQDGESALSIFGDGTDGLLQLPPGRSAAIDTAYLVGGAAQQGYVVTLADGSIFVRRYAADRFFPSTYGLFTDPALFANSIGGPRPESPRSAAANADGTRFLIAGATSAGPGRLYHVRRTFLSGGGVLDELSALADLPADPRRLRCAALSAPATAYLCAVSHFQPSLVTLLRWDGDAAVTVGPQVAVGSGPVGIDVFEGRVASTGFRDDSLTIVRTSPGDPLAAAPEVRTRAIAAVPGIAGCSAPGHAIFLRDADRSVAISCNGSDELAVLPGAY